MFIENDHFIPLDDDYELEENGWDEYCAHERRKEFYQEWFELALENTESPEKFGLSRDDVEKSCRIEEFAEWAAGLWDGDPFG